MFKRNVLDDVGALLFQIRVLNNLVVLTGAYLINCMLFHVLNDETHVSVMTLNYDPCSLICVFRCLCFVYNHGIHKNTRFKSTKTVFLRYSRTKKIYKCFDPSMGHWYVTKDMMFIKYVSYFIGNSP